MGVGVLRGEVSGMGIGGGVQGGGDKRGWDTRCIGSSAGACALGVYYDLFNPVSSGYFLARILDDTSFLA